MVLAVLSGCGKTQNTAKSSLREREALDSDRVFSITHSAYDGSFRNELTADELVFYNAFEQHFLEERSLNPFDVDISGMGYIGAETDYSRLGYLFQISLYAFCNDHPEAYWVGKANINYDCEDNSSHIVRAVITPSEQYAGAYSDWTAVQNGIREAVDEIRRSRASDSRYDTVLAIHDYVCNNLSYHYADEYYGEQQCAAPLFGGGSIGKKAVCEGYSMAFKLLCDQFGIPAAVVGSRTHAFNYVQMDDGIYYAVDCTFDDNADMTNHQFFLKGSRSIMDSVVLEESRFVCNRFNEDIDHAEYWYYIHDGLDHAPFVYPEVSETSYNRIEWVNGTTDSDNGVAGTVTFRFRCRDRVPAGAQPVVKLSDRTLQASDPDGNGEFEASCDTTTFYNGYKWLYVAVGDQTFSGFIFIDNPTFEILDWGDETRAVSAPYEVRVRGTASGNITDCKIDVWVDCWASEYGGYHKSTRQGTYSFGEDGIASFVLDPNQFDEGAHSFCVVFHKPGGNSFRDETYQIQSRTFRVFHSSADSGSFRFCGNSARNDRMVGEWADFNLKYDGAVTDKCRLDVMLDDVAVRPVSPAGEKITDFFDKDGYALFYLDMNGYSNGPHKLQATLTKADGSTLTATGSVQVTNGYFDYRLGQFNETTGWSYSSSRDTVAENFICIELKNTSGMPSSKCKLAIREDDMIVCDRMMTEDQVVTFLEDDTFYRNSTVPDIRYGEHFMKVVMKTPDGTLVEKSLPFHAAAALRYYDLFHFAVDSRSEVRQVGHTVDFTLLFASPYHVCQDLRLTVDGEPSDVQIPEDPGTAFDKFGRFSFTLDFPDKQAGEHVIQAEVTREDGLVVKTEQKFVITDGSFELTGWPDTEPTLNRVTDIPVKKLSDSGESEAWSGTCSVRQYIDGEDMGAVLFDQNGTATLSLNTAGLASGEHLYKAVFSDIDGSVVERLMRFRVA